MWEETDQSNPPKRIQRVHIPQIRSMLQQIHNLNRLPRHLLVPSPRSILLPLRPSHQYLRWPHLLEQLDADTDRAGEGALALSVENHGEEGVGVWGCGWPGGNWGVGGLGAW